MLLAVQAAAPLWAEYGVALVITSANDSRHSGTSLHYAGAGLDFRSRTLTRDQAKHVTDELRRCLGRDFDVVLESDHVHVEYQPRRPFD